MTNVSEPTFFQNFVFKKLPDTSWVYIQDSVSPFSFINETFSPLKVLSSAGTCAIP